MKRVRSLDKNFIQTILPTAQEVYSKTGVLPSLTISQAILETGGKLNNVLAKGFNFFGEKGTGDKGSIRVKTWEDYGDGAVTVYDNFKVYSDPIKGAAGRIKLLSNDRYKGVLQATSFNTQAKAIKAAGYATDPNYVSKLQGIYEIYDLGQYDLVKGQTGTNVTQLGWKEDVLEGVKDGLNDSVPGGKEVIEKVEEVGNVKENILKIIAYMGLIIVALIAFFIMFGGPKYILKTSKGMI